MSEVFARITFENGEIQATSENTSLYTHVGAEALKNHVWIVHEDGEHGARIWEHEPPNNPFYADLAPLVVQSGAELHVNIRKASQSDTEAFERAITRDADERPTWLDGA